MSTLEGTLIAVEITKIATLVDGSVSITLNTQELPPAKVGEIFQMRKSVAYAYISAQQIKPSERKIVDSLEPELKGKQPSKRLRAVLYLLWKENSEGYQDSESYYRAKMEHIIDTYKSELPPNH